MYNDIIHHSDRGVQYASFAYTDILKSRGIRISMTECGDPKDNAVAERVNGIIKNELLKDMVFHSIEEVKVAVADAIDFYNNERPHMSLDWKTPAEAALCSGELKKKWVSHRENFLKQEIAWRKIRNFGATQEKCLALCETGTRAEGEASAFTPLLFCYVFAYAAAVSTINVTKPHMYQPNIKVMFNRVNQH